MLKSKTKIENQLKRKTNPEIVRTIILAKKNPAWLEVASLLTAPASQKKNFNLSKINDAEGETIVIVGKVLGQGDLTKNKKIVALNFSESAKKKIKDAGALNSTIAEEIEKNKDAKGIVILK